MFQNEKLVSYGWNLIGNPLVSTVTIDSIKVNGYNWYEAAENEIISPVPVGLDYATATHKGLNDIKMNDLSQERLKNH